MHHRSTNRAITAVLAVVCLLLASCGSTTNGDEQADSAAADETDESSTPTDTSASATETATATTPLSTTSTTTEVAEKESIELATVLEVGGGARELPTGLYTDQALTSTGQLDMVEPIDVVFYEDSILVMRDAAWGEEVPGDVSFMAPLGVMPPDQAGIHQPHDPAIPDSAVPVPADLGAWLESIEQIEVTGTGSLETAAGGSTWYDFIVPDDAKTFDCGFHPTCIGVIVTSDGVGVFLTGTEHRLYQIDALPGLLAMAKAPPEHSSAVFARADGVVAGLGTRG